MKDVKISEEKKLNSKINKKNIKKSNKNILLYRVQFGSFRNLNKALLAKKNIENKFANLLLRTKLEIFSYTNNDKVLFHRVWTTSMIKDNGFTHTYKDTGKEGLNGWCDFTNNEIVIQENLSQAQTIKTTIHEIGHMFSHKDVKVMRSIKETEAESIAYVVSNYLGLDTSNYSIGYVAGWSGNEDFILKESVARVSKTSKLILDKLGI